MLPLAVVRWVLFALGIFGLLTATVLYRWYYDATIGAMLRLSERRYGRPVPLTGALGVVLKSHRRIRAWNLLNALVFLAAWWYLGTRSGVAWWTHVGTSAGAPQ
jgi:hypothetical protein